jgi:TetR/AcrR family transcriptional regulator, regulator of biofilm formation and stress response
MRRPDSHREATLARRRALLEAAVDVVAERGVGGATHREIARRAGLPLSTTSYFFASIDELVLEALQVFQTELLEQIDALRAQVASQQLTPIEAVDMLLAVLLAEPGPRIVAQFEGYLEASRRPEHRPAVAAVITAFERLAESVLAAAGARRPADAARAFVALVDGFALHRVTWPRPRGDRVALRRAMLDLFLAQLLSDDERSELDVRLDQSPAETASA